MTILEEARELGELAASRHNKWAETGVVCAREEREVADAYERAADLKETFGDAVRQAFAKSYDATIDFSVNADWREQ